MTQYISKDALVAEINKHIIDAPINYIGHQRVWAYNDVKDIIDTLEVKEDLEIDEKHKIGKWFTGLIPCWIDAPSTLQAAHNHHGKNIVAIHLKDGGYRCCCVDDKEPITFSLPENISLVEGWHNRESFWVFIKKVIDFLNYELDDVVATRVPGTIIPHHVAKQELIENLKKLMYESRLYLSEHN